MKSDIKRKLNSRRSTRGTIGRFVATTALVWALAGSVTVHAANFVVTTTADTGPDAPAPGSLRAALASAADGDTIDATGITGTITLMPSLISLPAELVVNKSLTILGPGPENLTVDANHIGRVFYLTPGHIVVIDGLHITNGVASGVGLAGYGGGIFNDHSSLTMNDCIVSGSTASVIGGGIFNHGAGPGDPDGAPGSATLTLTASTLIANSARFASALFNYGPGGGSATATLVESSVTGNSASVNGGIYNSGSATLTLIKSTLSSSGPIGILNNFGRVDITASTLSGNNGPVDLVGKGEEIIGLVNFDGLIRVSDSTFRGTSIRNGDSASSVVEIGNTIVDSTGLTGAINIFPFGTVVSRGFNLSSDNGGGFLTAIGDQILKNPLLGPLVDNGGPTLTHAPLAVSPAIDQGRAATFADLSIGTDQRGFARSVDDLSIGNASDGTDVGAVELGGVAPPPPVPVADLLISLGVDKTSVKQGELLTYTITVQNFGPGAATNAVVNDTLSSGTTFVSAHANKGSFTTPPANQTGVVTWNLGNLSNGEAEGAQLVVKVIVKGKTTVTNTATVSSDSDDPNPANNVAAITTTIAAGEGGSGGGGKKK